MLLEIAARFMNLIYTGKVIAPSNLSHEFENVFLYYILKTICRCKGIGDDGIYALSNGCKRMQKLNLSYCSEVTDRGIECLGNLPELSDLEMRSLLNITGTGLTALATGCKRLAELDVKDCANIDDSGFMALAYYSRNLQQV